MPRGEFDRTARKAQTREALLEAAARVYSRRGLDGATLDEVAAEAGFTKGAVYSHFGSKENLLVALLEEHLAQEAAEQLALFDRARVPSERPQAGSAHWMEGLERDPDSFRLFVELWSYAQRDERLRRRLAAGMAAMRSVWERFAEASALDAGLEPSPAAAAHFASVVSGLGLGLSMIRMIDDEALPPALLGATLSVLIRAMEEHPETRALLAEPEGSKAAARP